MLIRARPATAAAADHWWEYFQQARSELLAQGQVFRTVEAIDAERARSRAADDARRQGLRPNAAE